MTDETQYYFAYGSNMSHRQMIERTASATFVDIGYLEGYQLVFDRIGTYRAGGVASVQKVLQQSKRIYGVVWRISQADLKLLDAIEDPTAYKRSNEIVIVKSGEFLSCCLYKSIPQGNFTPDSQYLSIIIESATEANLPKDYISYLESFRTE